ncbi:family 2 glycosyl transferase [Hyphomicrobium denitrificans 1NES1]|uniref:Family 2 glycosyl transferase n=1 Tax=Hyphomicrobium denitrificans 1NES1 TaxID=670307 RepID=N0B1T6_9HYPH|nr:glycosyltransferase family 2 protein [Hyphomicrobium denitrificans]AGK57439.1 family 2 glycosyl transferase [Hyphomicrobium denitrificans 1NES1]
MNARLPLSCFIIAQDEGDRIARAIRSIKPWVDEVVVVDSGSSDDTVAVAQSEGARVIAQPWLGFGGQKRFAEEQCRYDWVLNLDADELISPKLRTAIEALFHSGSPEFVAYGMPVHVIYPGRQKPRIWARDNWYIRLYNRKIVRFRDSRVHDTVVTGEHQVGRIEAPIYHYSIRSFEHMRAKLDERMSLSAEHKPARNRLTMLARLLVEFPLNFYKYYVVRRHFTGGTIGLRYATIQSTFRVKKVYRMWRSRNPVPTIKDASPSNNNKTAWSNLDVANLSRHGKRHRHR